MCISVSPRFLRRSALAAFWGAQSSWTLRKPQRPGSWVMSSWGCISRFMTEEITGLAWLLQHKFGLLQESTRAERTHTHSHAGPFHPGVLVNYAWGSAKPYSQSRIKDSSQWCWYEWVPLFGSGRCIITGQDLESSLNHKWEEPNSHWLQEKGRLIGRTLRVWDTGTRDLKISETGPKKWQIISSLFLSLAVSLLSSLIFLPDSFLPPGLYA